MAEPQEVCEVHDLRIDQYGCWACGHGGPISEDVAPSWDWWVLSRAYAYTCARADVRRPQPIG
jgi:hypothetical protein